jgi:Fe-S-cluster containining protein
MAVEVDAPEDDRDIDDVRWYLLHRDVSVLVDREGAWFVAFHTPCEALGPDGRCTRYATRPVLCREHGRPPEACEYEAELFPLRFDTVEEFERWLALQN